MTSDRQRHSGLVLPENLTQPNLICATMMIPNEREYIAAFVGQITALGRWYTWEKSFTEGDTRASVAAQYWRELIQKHLCISYGEENVPCGCCEDQTILLINQRTTLTTIINNQRAASWEAENPQTIDSDAPASGSNFNYTGDFTGDIALCEACKALVVQVIANTIFAYGAAAAVLGAITTALSLLAGPLGGLIGGAATAVVGVAREALVEALQDTEAVDNVACQLYVALLGVEATQANFMNAIDTLSGVTAHEILLANTLRNTCGNSSILGGIQRQYNYFLFLADLGQSWRNVEGGITQCPCGCDTETRQYFTQPQEPNMTIDTIVFEYPSGYTQFEGKVRLTFEPAIRATLINVQMARFADVSAGYSINGGAFVDWDLTGQPANGSPFTPAPFDLDSNIAISTLDFGISDGNLLLKVIRLDVCT